MDINIHQSDLHQATNNQEQWSTVQDLEDAIRQMERAGLKDEVERRKWRSAMRDLSILLQYRYEFTDDPHDLERAIEIADAVLDCSTAAEPDEACWLHHLTGHMIRRFGRAPDSEALRTKAIRFAEWCMASTSSSHPHQFAHRLLLVEVRDRHCASTTDSAIINQAIDNVEAARSIMSADYGASSGLLSVLRRLYRCRFENNLDTKDIDSLVGTTRLLAEMADIDDPRRSCMFHYLAKDLYDHFKHSRNLAKLNEAVAEMRFAVSVTPADHDHWVDHLMAQGQFLDRRFQETNQLEDINEAIEIAERVIEATPEEDPERGK
ncbi:hypothetical protein Daus18300_004528 [Diaporthe australafricana]|uniref:Uncharacterized protein n=1 Tax=Diaporthe australafricana TaxID=127596 RepID=A0ABR3X8G5_9PEZI